MIIRVQGEANALALFDYFNRKGVTWLEPTKRGDSWHTLRINIQTQDYFATKFDCKAVFPNMRISFK